MGGFSKLRTVFKKYPLIRGMASYSVIWPISSLIQQTFEGKSFGMHHLLLFDSVIGVPNFYMAYSMSKS